MASIEKNDALQSFDVPEIQRHPEGYTIYKIILQITPKEITENSYQLIYWKRYSEIRKLYETLHRYHQAIYRPGKFPDFPTKAGYMERFNPNVIEERRVATKEFLNFAVQHFYLRTHDAYINFFQKGEKMILPDVDTEILKPESSSNITVPVNKETTDDLLLSSVDEHENRTSNKILEDLNDLRFDENPSAQTDLEDLLAISATHDIHSSSQ